MAMSRKTLLSLLVVVLVASFVSACGSSHKTPLPITVQLVPPPPASLEVSTSAQLAADTTNDTAAAGVDWTVTCTSSNCGSLSPAHTASGGATTYTAPPTVPTGVTVTITAASTTTPASTASATITITPIGSTASLTGQYAFVATGLDTNGPYTVAGSITADGAGNISGGEEDFVDPAFQNLAASMLGTYTVGSDGRGSLNLTVANFGTQTFSFAITSANHAQLIEFDNFALSSGTLDLQDPTTFAASIPMETIVFTASGVDTVDSFTTIGGVLSADGVSALTGAVDVNEGGVFTPGIPAGGSYTAVDGNGRGTFNLGVHNYSFYMVGAEAFKLAEIDGTEAFVGGSVFGAGAAPSAGYTVANLTGNFVFNDNAQGGLGPVGAVGQFTADGAGNVTGFADANEGGFLSSGAIAGTYVVPDPTQPRIVLTLAPATGSTFTTDISNIVVYLADPALNLLDPTNPIVGGGAIVLEGDNTTNGIGYVIEQSPSTQSGNYAVSTQTDALFGPEADLVGQGLSDGTANITGNADQDDLGVLTPDAPLALTFAADPNNPGRFTGTLGFNGGTPVDIVYYQASSTQLVVIQADPTSSDVAVGYLLTQ
jgi:hypothetical protein